MANPAPVRRSRQASFDDSAWLPTYAWWPPAKEFSATVILSTYQAAVSPKSTFWFALRGYAGSADPVWEHEIGLLEFGEQRAIRLDDLDIPAPPAAGGLLEVHAVRRDRSPDNGAGYLGMWVDADGREGGGYLIPSTPIRGASKTIRRDDVQVIPGILATREIETEVLMLNPYDVTSRVRLVASSVDGLSAGSDEFAIDPWSTWRGDLSDSIGRLRALLAPGDGVGSLTVHSTHKILPFFGFRCGSNPVVSMDHAAPLFG
jgi:hypothetical protein